MLHLPLPHVYTVQKPVDYLTGEDVTLYKGLGPVYFQPKTISMSALAHFQLGLLLLHGKYSGMCAAVSLLDPDGQTDEASACCLDVMIIFISGAAPSHISNLY